MPLDRSPIDLILSDLFSRPIGALLSRCVGLLCVSLAPSARPRSLRRIGPFQPVSGPAPLNTGVELLESLARCWCYADDQCVSGADRKRFAGIELLLASVFAPMRQQ